MQRQNELIPHWITPEALSGTEEDLQSALRGLIIDTHDVTEKTPGGVWILRALRAVPTLQQLRLESHAQVTQEQAALLAIAFPDADAESLRLVGRIAVDLMYATVELLCDEPLNADAVAEIVAGMIASHMTRLRPQVAVGSKRRPSSARSAR